jgi:fumarate hydratase subunit beta
VKEAIREHHAVYLAAIGGAGALISRAIRKAEVIAYPELGTEAVMRLEVADFPAIVVNDVHGGDLYETGVAEYREEKSKE